MVFSFFSFRPSTPAPGSLWKSNIFLFSALVFILIHPRWRWKMSEKVFHFTLLSLSLSSAFVWQFFLLSFVSFHSSSDRLNFSFSNFPTQAMNGEKVASAPCVCLFIPVRVSYDVIMVDFVLFLVWLFPFSPFSFNLLIHEKLSIVMSFCAIQRKPACGTNLDLVELDRRVGAVRVWLLVSSNGWVSLCEHKMNLKLLIHLVISMLNI